MQEKMKDSKIPKSKTNPMARPGEIQSELTLSDLELLRAQHSNPDEFYLELFDSVTRVHSPPPSWLAVYEENFWVSLRFFIFFFIFELFRFYGIAFCAVSPNSFRYIIGFLILYSQIGVRPSILLFQALFTLKKHPYVDWLYVSSQKDVTSLVSDAPSSIHK